MSTSARGFARENRLPAMSRLYPIVRGLHLYCGLFISPFVLVFACSVFFLVHAWLPHLTGARRASPRRTTTGLRLPPDLDRLENRRRVDAVRPVLDELGVAGEIYSIRHLPGEHRLIITVSVPGRETTVDLDYAQRVATISPRDTGLAEAFVWLHKSPGPHLAAIRGNWAMTQIWRLLADAWVYVVLFLSLSGIYLWTALRAERTVGLVLIALGATSFFGLVYALSR
jgi:hypothetical protein